MKSTVVKTKLYPMNKNKMKPRVRVAPSGPRAGSLKSVTTKMKTVPKTLGTKMKMMPKAKGIKKTVTRRMK